MFYFVVPVLVVLLFTVLPSLLYFFTSMVSFAGFYTEDNPIVHLINAAMEIYKTFNFEGNEFDVW